MKKKIILIVGLILLLLISTFIYGIFNIKLTLKGNEEITINAFEKYEDEGFNAKLLFFKLDRFVDRNNEVDNKVLGSQEVCYELTFLFINKKACRTINIVDKMAPVITLKGDDEVKIYLYDNFIDPGYEVTDNYDKEVNVVVENNINNKQTGTYKVNYTATDNAGNTTAISRTVIVNKLPERYIPVIKNPIAIEPIKPQTGFYQDIIPGPTYIKGLLIVNKKYSLPSTYALGVDSTAKAALDEMIAAAKNEGYTMKMASGYRSYDLQTKVYNSNVTRSGVEKADKVSARPGHSEHQTGLAFDMDYLGVEYATMPNGIWLKNNCYKYGFIIRYPEGKENITGYSFEPWHIRYVGVEHATNINNQNITLEEYLGI